MSNANDRQDPGKRSRAASGAGAPKQPTARKSARPAASSKKPKSPSAPSSSARSSKPAVPGQVSKVAKSFKGAVVPKTSRTSKIPRTTTTSKIGRSSSPYGGSSHVADKTGSWSSGVSARNRDSFESGQRPHRSQPRNAKVRRISTGAFPTSKNIPQSNKPREKGMPQSRASSASNEFIEYTRTHKQIMIPVFIVVALLVIYTVFDIGASFGKIHPGVSVQGVDVGGMTVEQASQKLNDELTPVLLNAHVAAYRSGELADADGAELTPLGVEQAYADETAASDVTGNGETDKWNITAETIGAYIDGEALADEAYLIGRKGNFVAERFFSWFGGTKLDAQVSVREERYNALKQEIDAEVGHPIVDSSISIDRGVVSVVDGRDGESVDSEDFLKRFSSCAFASDHSAFVIPMQVDPMHIKRATAERVADDVKKAIAQDVTIVHSPDTWTLDSADLGEIISQQVLTPNEVLVFGSGTQKVVADEDAVSDYDTSAWADPDSGYVLQAFVDQKKTDDYLVGILGPLATGGAEDAYFDTSSGEVVLVESVQGFGPDRSAAEIALQTLLFGEPDAKDAASRTITLVDMVIEPELTTEKAQSMGITERLATWTIPLSGTSERINNIRLLCNLINNSLVAPGATWSFNGTTGERTAEKGFQTAPVIINGKHEDQLGGGICQIATCIFNAACFSGLGIQERVNHDFYISSYDDYGFADATVSWKAPDLKWVNDMSTYVLMTATVTDSNVVVSFWGTKDGRTVECQRGSWKDGDKYVSITEVDPTLSPGERKVTQGGQDGRSIDIRYLATASDGTVLHDVTFHSIYSAQNEIITIGPSVEAPAATPEPEAQSAEPQSAQPPQ